MRLASYLAIARLTTKPTSRKCVPFAQVWISVDTMAKLRTLRMALKTAPKYRGRACTQYIDDMGLKKGDRLEPTAAMPDVFAIDTKGADDLPLLLCFWRTIDVPLCHHRNPLICRTAPFAKASAPITAFLFVPGKQDSRLPRRLVSQHLCHLLKKNAHTIGQPRGGLERRSSLFLWTLSIRCSSVYRGLGARRQYGRFS